MSRVAIEAREAQSSDEVEIALFHIEHEALDAPIRIASGWTERLTEDPLTYGARSKWLGADPVTEPFLYLLMSAEIPGDMDDAPAGASIILDNVDRGIGDILRSITHPRATVHMAVVLASDPDTPELEVHDLKLMEADGSNGEHTLVISREPIEAESIPADRMTRDRFPGLFA